MSSTKEEANEANTSGSSTDSNIEFDPIIYHNHNFRRHATQPLEDSSSSSNAEQSTSDCLNTCQQIHPTQETQEIVDLTGISSDEYEFDTPGTSMVATQGSSQGSSDQDNDNLSVEVYDVSSPIVGVSSQGSSDQVHDNLSVEVIDVSSPIVGVSSQGSSDQVQENLSMEIMSDVASQAVGVSSQGSSGQDSFGSADTIDVTQSQESQSQEMFPMTLSQSAQDLQWHQLRTLPVKDYNEQPCGSEDIFSQSQSWDPDYVPEHITQSQSSQSQIGMSASFSQDLFPDEPPPPLTRQYAEYGKKRSHESDSENDSPPPKKK